MIDYEKKRQRAEQREYTRRRMHVNIDPENYEYEPAEDEVDFYDVGISHNVAIYVRVSTDDPRQTTSFELQKKYYDDLVAKHENWNLVEIYADEGKSGTQLRHRDNFLRMIDDAKEHKFDLIITKSVSRFARNVVDFLTYVRMLAKLKPAVGVFFESEAFFSLKDDNQMALSFLSTMAEEESHIRSRSMESSLRMRLDNGIPLTPKLLGYTHDEQGHLIINHEEAPTVKLAFYMYLYGYSSQQIADALTALGRKTYLGNVKWTANSIVQVLRNERHCGDVYTRKTYTPDYHDHKSVKNYHQRPHTTYRKHHEAIVRRDDFIAVQHMLDNAKYKNKTYLPELRVIEDGILKGFVTINPRWAAFKEFDYFEAAKSAYKFDEKGRKTKTPKSEEIEIEVNKGDFDLRGFEIARSEFFNNYNYPSVSFENKKIKFNREIIKRLGSKNNIELLINPVERKFALRTTKPENRQSVCCSKPKAGVYQPRDIPAAAFFNTLYTIFGWNLEYKYKIKGDIYQDGKETVYIFDTDNAEIFFKSYMLPTQEYTDNESASIQPLTSSGSRIRAIPQEWAKNFGDQYYLHEQTIAELKNQKEREWKLRLEGKLYDTGKKMNITPFEELKAYIDEQLNGVEF